MSNNRIWIVIPVFNEANVILKVIQEIKKAGYQNIIVVDDGSSDDSFHKLKKTNVVLLRHKINRGKGAAVKTGIEAIKILGADIAITVDGDGQHNPNDIKNMLEKINQNYDVVLGTRLTNPQGMPWYKIIANYIGNFFTWIIYGLWVTDSQSGFRAYSKNALKKIDTQTDRYEYDSEIIKEIYRNKLKYTEIPIEVRYTDHSMNKKQKQGFINGIKTILKMILSN